MSLTEWIQQTSKAWHGVRVGQPDWGSHSHSFALSARLESERAWVYLILNAYWEPLDFELPTLSDEASSAWCRWIDTSLPSPEDIVPWEAAPTVTGRQYQAGARSVVVLIGSIV